VPTTNELFTIKCRSLDDGASGSITLTRALLISTIFRPCERLAELQEISNRLIDCGEMGVDCL